MTRHWSVPGAGDRFLCFALVGVLGFGVDVSVLALCLILGLGLYGGRLVSYPAAATTTWWLNRRFTFIDAARTDAVGELAAVQWAKFLAVNALGGMVNYGVYAAVVTWLAPVAAHPTLGVAAGSLAGLVFNFAGSRRFVFSRAPMQASARSGRHARHRAI